MGRAKDEAGNIWETDAAGNAVRMLSPGGQGMGPAIGNDPRMPFQTQKAQNDAAASEYAAPKAAADTTSAQADAAFARQVAEAQARKAEADARTAEANANSGSAKAATTVRADAIAGYQSAQQLYKIIDGLNAKFQAGPGKTSGVAGVRDYLPYTENQQFDRAGEAARGLVGQALGFTGGQLNTEREAAKAIGPYLPESGDRDAVIKDKIARLTELAKAAESRSISVLGGRPDPNGNIIPIKPDPNAPPAPPPGGLPQDQVVPSTGGTRTEVDEFRKGVMTRMSQMVVQGRPRAEVEKFIRENGLDPNAQSLSKLYQFRSSPAFDNWQRANPGAILPLDPKYYTREVAMSGREQFNSKAAQSAPGAFFGAAGNAVAGGHLDDIIGAAGGDREAANTAMMLNQSNHPGVSFMGDVAGQGLVEAGLGRVPGLRALYGKRFGQMGMDALTGAYAGSGSEDGGTLSGAIGNAAGGSLFRGAARASGGLLKGVTNPNLRYLNERNVPLTIGQIGRGSDSIVGQGIGGLEDRAAGLPIFDAIINSARKRGEVGFNEAAFREAGGSGATGSAGATELGGKVNNAYSFLDGTNLPLDAPYAGSQAAVRAGLPNLPAFGPEIGRSMDTLDKAASGGSLSGRDWQSGVRSVRANRSSVAGQPFADEATASLGDIQDNLMGLAQRQGPAGTLDNLKGANKLNAQYQTILSALDNGPTQARGELFSAKGLDTSSRRGAGMFGGKAASMRGERPLYNLTAAGMDVMPNQVPDSGTAGRSLMYSTLFGAGLGGGLGYGADSATGGDGGEGAAKGGVGGATLLPFVLASLYSKPGQKGLQKALLGPRSKVAEQYGQALLDPRVQSLFGSLGTGTFRDLFLYPELNK